MWGADGRLVSAGAGFIWGWVRGCDAGASGTYAVWCERRAGVFDVYVQLLDTAGNRRWDSLGVVVGSVNSSQEQAVAAIGDGRTGVIVAWPMYSDSTASWDVYAQRVDSAGQLLWGASGFGVAVDSGRQSSPSVATDARGGAIVVWGRSYAGDSVGLSAQRIGDAVSVTEPWMEFPRHSSLSVNPNPTRRVFSVGYDVTRSDHVLVGIHYCPVISRIVSVG